MAEVVDVDWPYKAVLRGFVGSGTPRKLEITCQRHVYVELSVSIGLNSFPKGTITDETSTTPENMLAARPSSQPRGDTT